MRKHVEDDKACSSVELFDDDVEDKTARSNEGIVKSINQRRARLDAVESAYLEYSKHRKSGYLVP
jgi:hypothetical protein